MQLKERDKLDRRLGSTTLAIVREEQGSSRFSVAQLDRQLVGIWSVDQSKRAVQIDRLAVCWGNSNLAKDKHAKCLAIPNEIHAYLLHEIGSHDEDFSLGHVHANTSAGSSGERHVNVGLCK